MRERRLAYVRVVAELGLLRWAHPMQLSLLVPAVCQNYIYGFESAAGLCLREAYYLLSLKITDSLRSSAPRSNRREGTTTCR
jgi:hypothetical protein